MIDIDITSVRSHYIGFLVANRTANNPAVNYDNVTGYQSGILPCPIGHKSRKYYFHRMCGKVMEK